MAFLRRQYWQSIQTIMRLGFPDEVLRVLALRAEITSETCSLICKHSKTLKAPPTAGLLLVAYLTWLSQALKFAEQGCWLEALSLTSGWMVSVEELLVPIKGRPPRVPAKLLLAFKDMLYPQASDIQAATSLEEDLRKAMKRREDKRVGRKGSLPNEHTIRRLLRQARKKSSNEARFDLFLATDP